MEKHNFVREGVSRLPPGFRFQPTDEEIVFQYLKSKVFSLPLPASIIPELHFSKFDPWDLPGDPEEERYFFTKKEVKYRSRKRTNRATSSGYWKATGSDKHIHPPPRQNLGMPIKGLRKTFVFYRGKSPNGCRTDWFMHEYSLLLNVMPSNDHMTNSFLHNQSLEGIPRMEDWVICCVFLKQRKDKDNDATMSYSSDHNNGLSMSTLNMDNMRLLNTRMDNRDLVNHTFSYSSSSSSSNSIPGNSSNELEDDEETSYSP